MASQTTKDSFNGILNEYIHQVTGSTPSSIKDMLKLGNVAGNDQVAMKLATIGIYAAAVNKSTLESFIARAPVQEARTIVGNQFSIQGKANMSALSLFGHCLLTSDFIDGINFVDQFRARLGQRHIWEKDLEQERLSKEQFKIFNQKKSSSPRNDAFNLGRGYFKIVGLDKRAMTAEEAAFWGVTVTPADTRTIQPKVAKAPSPPKVESPKRDSFEELERSSMVPGDEVVTYGTNTAATIPGDVLKYYRTVYGNDQARMEASIAKRSPEGFVRSVREMIAKDPEMKMRPGGSVIG
jgi:hypothetical protein